MASKTSVPAGPLCRALVRPSSSALAVVPWCCQSLYDGTAVRPPPRSTSNLAQAIAASLFGIGVSPLSGLCLAARLSLLVPFLPLQLCRCQQRSLDTGGCRTLERAARYLLPDANARQRPPLSSSIVGHPLRPRSPAACTAPRSVFCTPAERISSPASISIGIDISTRARGIGPD